MQLIDPHIMDRLINLLSQVRLTWSGTPCSRLESGERIEVNINILKQDYNVYLTQRQLYKVFTNNLWGHYHHRQPGKVVQELRESPLLW